MSKYLLITCDDFGMHEDANDGVIDILKQGVIQTTSIMACGPAYEDAVKKMKQADLHKVGVHLTLGSEYPENAYYPVLGSAAVPSLVNADGYFYPEISKQVHQMSLSEVRDELEAQISRVESSGLTLTHLDGHMFFYEADEGGTEIFNVVKDLAQQRNLPIRVKTYRNESPIDDVLMIWGEVPNLKARQDYYEQVFATLKNPFTELIIHPIQTPSNIQGFTNSAEWRYFDYLIFQDSNRLLSLMESYDVTVIGWPEVAEGVS